MFNTGFATPSLADIAAVTGNDRNNDGFGNGAGGWWVLIILLALFGGFNNGGWGNGNRDNCGGVSNMGYGYGFENASIQRGFDNQAVINKLNGLENGVCDLGYNQLAQINGVNQNISQTSFGLQQAINSADVNNMQNTNALSRQIADCCCETRAGLADIHYTMATDTCAINTNIHQTGDAIIQSQNAGFQMLNNTINDRFTRLELSQKDQRIAELEAKLIARDRDSALADQATYLLSRLDPRPVPSYNVQNPNCCSPLPVTVQSNDCGCCGSNSGRFCA